MKNVPDFLQPLVQVTQPFPRQALEEAIARREEAFPVLLEVLAWAAENPQDVPRDYLLHEYAIRLLAQFRDIRCYEVLVRLARDPLADELLGETLSSDLGPILASVSGGDSGRIQELVEDADADEFARWGGLRALGVLCHEGLLAREALSAYLGELFAGKLERKWSYVWTGLVGLCVDFGFTEHGPSVHRAIKDDRVDLSIFDPSLFETRLHSGEFSSDESRHYRFFSDAIGSMQNWHCFDPMSAFDDEPEWDEDDTFDKQPSWDNQLATLAELPPPPQPVRAEFKPGRNDPCSCGSGKKFKKCCGGRQDGDA
jgi:hypothetical protein